jgi:hypothetical protein
MCSPTAGGTVEAGEVETLETESFTLTVDVACAYFLASVPTKTMENFEEFRQTVPQDFFKTRLQGDSAL